MGLFAGMNAGLYRFTTDGRRVISPFSPVRFRRIHYLVPDSEIRFVERRQRWSFVGLMVVTIIFTNSRLLPQRWWLWLVVLAFIVLTIGIWVPRGLSKVDLEPDDFAPVDRRARTLAHARATGEGTLWALLVATLAMASIDVILIVTDGIWWAWIGLLIFGSCTAAMAREIFLLRRFSTGRWPTDPTVAR